MINEKVLLEWLKGKKYITVDEESCLMTEGFEKEHQWELSRNCFINKVIKFIEEQPKVGEWIPCKRELPEDETLMYWTTHEDGSLVMHGYTRRNGFIYNWEVDDLEKRKRQGQVIAWTPIFKPEPYKEEVTE